MSEDSTPEDVTNDVLALIHRAREAVREQNLPAVIDDLAAAVSIYEQQPSQAHAPMSQLRGVLVFIRSARSLCKTLKRPEEDLRDLEQRAEVLRRPLH